MKHVLFFVRSVYLSLWSHSTMIVITPIQRKVVVEMKSYCLFAKREDCKRLYCPLITVSGHLCNWAAAAERSPFDQFEGVSNHKLSWQGAGWEVKPGNTPSKHKPLAQRNSIVSVANEDFSVTAPCIPFYITDLCIYSKNLVCLRC